VLRIDQPGWETAILDGLGERLHPERIAMVIVPHHPGDTASTLLARAGFALYCFPGRLARGPLAPFTDEEGLILALAPWVRPAAFYGPDIWPPLPERIDEAGAEAARLGKAGLAATRGGAGSDADRILAQALIRDPFCPAANAGKGRMLAEDGRLEAAALFLTRALLPGPDPTVSAELAQVLRRLRRFDEAEAAHRAASPGADTAESVFAGALIARDRGRLIDAARLLQRAAALAPGDAMITVAAAELRLADGDPAGLAGLAPSAPPPPPGAPPLWSGEPLEARTLLVSCGDDIALALMLARYIPLIPGRGGLVALICPAELGPLLALLPGVESVANPDDPLPEADLWAPLVALPSLLERRAPPRPPGVPYLVWPEAATRRRFGSDDRLRIGLAGAEGVCPLDLLLLLAAEPDIALVALGGAEVDNVIAAAGAGALVERPSPLPEDLAETVALIAGLDLVLGGDGVETHLAGALGKPVWVLLPEGFSWLWPTARDNSPFYPTARLFRPTAEGWAPTIERMREALLALAADKRQRGASFI
jgi:tetratricopeptide (TPR) repeat protein